MNGLLLASSPQNQDIEFNSKKVIDIKNNISKGESEKGILFAGFLESLLQESPQEKPDKASKSTLSAFLKEPSIQKESPLLTPKISKKSTLIDKEGKITIEALIEIATMLQKNGDKEISFPTDTKALKEQLSDIKVQQDLKNAKTVADLLNVARKNGIEVKEFTFFQEKSSTLTKENQPLLQKIDTQKFFDLMQKEPATAQTILSTTPKSESGNEGILQNLLSRNQSNKHQNQIASASSKTKHVLSASLTTPVPKHQTKALISEKEGQKITSLSTILKSSTPLPQTNISTTLTLNKEAQGQISLFLPNEQTSQNRSKATPKPTAPSLQKHPIHTKTEKNLFQNLFNELKNPDKQLSFATLKELLTQQKPTSQLKTYQPQTKTTIQQVDFLKETSQVIQNRIIENTTPHHSLQNTLPKTTNITTNQASQTESIMSDSPTVSHETHEVILPKTAPQTTTLESKNHPSQHKQLFSNFAQEFKEQVENYKAPLMKVKMALNPGNLGEVDVTLINRGNNLHVSIHSNPQAIALFTQNQAEFRNALINMGFSSLQMSFGDKEQQRGGQHTKESSKNSRSFQEETNEVESLQLIVPYYV